MQFFVYTMNMLLYSGRSDAKLSGNLFVKKSFGQQQQDLLLPCGQRLKMLVGRSRRGGLADLLLSSLEGMHHLPGDARAHGRASFI